MKDQVTIKQRSLKSLYSSYFAFPKASLAPFHLTGLILSLQILFVPLHSSLKETQMP